MKKKLEALKDWLVNTPPAIKPAEVSLAEPTKPTSPKVGWFPSFLIAFIVAGLTFYCAINYVASPKVETEGQKISYGLLSVVASGVVFFVVLLPTYGISLGRHKARNAGQWNEYEAATVTYNELNSEYQTEVNRYNAKLSKYNDSIKERNRKELWVSTYESIFAMVESVGKEQASLSLRETLPPFIYKEFLMEYFGPAALFQFEQLELQQIQTNSVIRTEEYSRQTAISAQQAAGAAQVAAVGSLITAYNTRRHND